MLFQLPDDGEAAHGLAVDGRRDEETAIAVGAAEDDGGSEGEMRVRLLTWRFDCFTFGAGVDSVGRVVAAAVAGFSIRKKAD